VDLERGSLSFMSTTEELLGRKVAAPVQNTEVTALEDPPRWLRDITLSAKELPLTSPRSGARSVGIVRLQTKATELVLLL
jgi:hypothetical protein